MLSLIAKPPAFFRDLSLVLSVTCVIRHFSSATCHLPFLFLKKRQGIEGRVDDS
jgi:hypothetical protein